MPIVNLIRLANSSEYTDVLEPRVPAWDVWAGEPAIVARGRFSAAQVDIARHGVSSAGRLGHDRLRLCVLAERSRVNTIGLGHSIELAWPLQDAGSVLSRRNGCNTFAI